MLLLLLFRFTCFKSRGVRIQEIHVDEVMETSLGRDGIEHERSDKSPDLKSKQCTAQMLWFTCTLDLNKKLLENVIL